MKFYRLQMPETWQPQAEDATLYREHDNGRIEVLNYNDVWQPSMMDTIEEVRSYYTDDPDRDPEDRWTLTEIEETEVPVATEG